MCSHCVLRNAMQPSEHKYLSLSLSLSLSIVCLSQALLQTRPHSPSHLTPTRTANSDCYAYIDYLSYGGPTTTCSGMKDNETPALAAAEAQRKLDEKKKQETTALIVLGCIAAVVVVVLLIVGFVVFSVMKKKRLSAEIAEANKREQELDARAGSSDNSAANATLDTNAAFTDSEEDDVETGAAVVGGTAVQGARKVAGDGIVTAETSAATQGVVPKGGELSGEETAASIATTSVRTCAAEGGDETQVDLAAHKSMPPPTASKAGGSGETHVEPADPTNQLAEEEPSIAADGIGEKNETGPDVSTVDVEAAAGDAAAAVPVLTATDPPDEEGSATSTPPSASAPAEEADERIE